MQFTKKLHAGIQSGSIDCSIRIWQQPRVKVGGRYRLGAGHVVVDDVQEILLEDVTPRMARRSGFEGLDDLLETARHGRGERVFLVAFHYEEDGAPKPRPRKEADPERFKVPDYLGARGWVSYRIDLEEVDWELASALLRESYRLVAPRKLAAALDEGA